MQEIDVYSLTPKSGPKQGYLVVFKKDFLCIDRKYSLVT